MSKGKTYLVNFTIFTSVARAFLLGHTCVVLHKQTVGTHAGQLALTTDTRVRVPASLEASAGGGYQRIFTYHCRHNNTRVKQELRLSNAKGNQAK